MKEHEVIDRLRKAFPTSGIGDDTAVLPAFEALDAGAAGGRTGRGVGAKRVGGKAGRRVAAARRAVDLLFASDAIVEDVHFRRETSTLSQAIQKLVTSNVSDVYAMGGRPLAIVFTAALSSGISRRDVDGIIDGLRKACSRYKVRLAGGDTVYSPHGLVFDVAIVGSVARGRAIRRFGARAGDRIVLFGEIGLARAGLSIVSAIFEAHGARGVPLPSRELRSALAHAARLRKPVRDLTLAASSRTLRILASRYRTLPHAGEILRCAKRHLVPLAVPLDRSVLEAPRQLITSMIDVSDGLAKDLRTLCAESGVGAGIHEVALPVPKGIREMFDLGERELADFAISSGEEYVLLATVRGTAPAGALPFGTAIGTVMRPGDGIVLMSKKGASRPMPELGYEHSF